MALKFYTSVAKGLKWKIKKFWELILTFVESTEKKAGRGELFALLLFILIWGNSFPIMGWLFLNDWE